MLKFHCLSFHELSNDQLYDLIKLRVEVFVLEQNCPYQDLDDKDQESYHVIGIDDNGIIQACTRLLPPGLSYEGYSSIGRVITSKNLRGKRQGSPLMQYSIDKTFYYWPDHPIKISSQVYVKEFYEKLGFEIVGQEYLEDDIPHIAMILKPCPADSLLSE